MLYRNASPKVIRRAFQKAGCFVFAVRTVASRSVDTFSSYEVTCDPRSHSIDRKHADTFAFARFDLITEHGLKVAEKFSFYIRPDGKTVIQLDTWLQDNPSAGNFEDLSWLGV